MTEELHIEVEHRLKAWRTYTELDPEPGRGLEWVNEGVHKHISQVAPKELELLNRMAAAFAYHDSEVTERVRKEENAIFADHLARRMGKLLICPHCGEQHVDEGVWASRLHITHICEHCGAKFADETYSVGV